MAMNNRERVARGMEQVRAALIPFAERELKARFGNRWFDEVSSRVSLKMDRSGAPNWDTQALLKAFVATWGEVFRTVLDNSARNYVGELIDVRNRWAHEEPFSSDDTFRALDTMQRLLEALPAAEAAEEVGKLKVDLQRTVFAEQARSKTRHQLVLEGVAKTGLKPWREVVTPHPDVASGRYMQAEFAADLAQVHTGHGSDEYRDPVEFFRRTYITAGLKELLSGALRRIAGTGGDPVVELQTNFGGGKTHSMLALYHLFGPTPSGELPGVEGVLREAGVSAATQARRAVLVGTHMSPGEVSRKADGTTVRTMWGDLAWQLGGAEGFALVADSDARGVSPGSEVLAELFRRNGPCLVLVDEWVAYARQTVGKRDLPAGDFEAQATFAQALTEAAKNAPGTLVVASIPASKIEIGGENGELALETLKNVFERVGTPWRPATGDEGFEIVRRRLFEPIADKDAFANRDAVLNAFARLYKENASEFPSGTAERSYAGEILAAYPIHPELFRRLYDDWSTLDKFQRTRGVLRLLAKVIHRLWEDGDGGLMIMPSSIPIDDPGVKSELTRYLDDVWEPIIAQDVDGERSLPLEIDREVTNLGRISACRRVARTLYMGTAPSARGDNAGIDDRRVRLGCVQPGEAPQIFGDALRRISDRAKYIHQDGNRYWISTKANLNRLAEDRAAENRRDVETLYAEIARRLEVEKEARNRGEFAGVHACPAGSGEVSDEPAARLVILSPREPHQKGKAGSGGGGAGGGGAAGEPGKNESPAARAAREILDRRGNAPRLERNCLVFLAADKKELEPLLDATAQYLAWKSIDDENERLNLDAFQRNQARTKRADSDRTVDLRISGTWIHALVPHQEEPTSEVVLEEVKVSGGDSLAKRTSARLVLDEALIVDMAGTRLRMALDRYLWREKDHVSVGQLGEWFARYLYLPRVKNRETIHRAVHDGSHTLVVDETFATADGWDEAKGRYVGLRAGGGSFAAPTASTLVVKPEVARAQLDAERAAEARGDGSSAGAGASAGVGGAGGAGGAGAAGAGAGGASAGGRGVSTGAAPAAGSTPGEGPWPDRPAEPAQPNSYVAYARLDEMRLARDAQLIGDEVLQHLASLPGAEVEVTLEIRVRVPSGIPDDAIRTVAENARTLKFETSVFERD